MKSLVNITPEELRTRKIVEWGYTQEDQAVSHSRYQNWIRQGQQGSLNYLTGERATMRASLSRYYPSFQSALVFLFDYSREKKGLDAVFKLEEGNNLKMGSYAMGFGGKDYHLTIREDLHWMGMRLKEKYSDLDFKLSLDVQPVLERDLAWRAGLGWMGKNSMLIHREHGSFVILGSLLFNKKLFPEHKAVVEVDHCGTCRDCVDACPTEAIEPTSRTLMAEKCISTFTIEHFKDDVLPPAGYHKKANWFFGCDICQDVCPWNGKPLSSRLAHSFDKALEKSLLQFFLTRSVATIVEELGNMSNKGFVRLFKETVFARTGRIGLLKNLQLFKR